MTPPLPFGTFPKIHLIWWPNPSLKQMPRGQHTVPFDAACPLDEQCVCTLCKCCLNCSNKCSCNFANTGADESLASEWRGISCQGSRLSTCKAKYHEQ